ncbi:phage baseplate assembly protein V [Billgrantia desiderata]|uniref:phage baseplate assembly protein V n=1 Tax=Billgrantia desiderata TaxID=52021 RepID=UPI00089EB493|nr:phage baseplate assembly protein V [Halomonas desiderata]SEG44027.1 phage baseplate assembly protein V [Halomonas desiderata]
MNPIELLRLLHNLIRLGTVHEVDHARARVRVVSGELITDWLPWLSPRAGTTRDWSPPTVGEQVLVLSPGGDPAAGVVLTGVFSDDYPAPTDDGNLIGRWLPDGTRLEYDHAAHKLTIECVGDIQVKASGTVNLEAAKIHHNGGKGIVTQDHICHLTGLPHGDGSSTVTAGK